MSESDGLLQYNEHGQEGSSIETEKRVERFQPTGGETEKVSETASSSLQPNLKTRQINATVEDDKHSRFRTDTRKLFRDDGNIGTEVDRAMEPENAEMLEFDTPKPREKKIELITYKSIECGLSVTDSNLVSESSVNMISTSRNHKEIVFETGDEASGDSVRFLSFCRSVKSFTITTSFEGPVMPGSSGRPSERNSGTKVLRTEPELSSVEIETILDEWDTLINCVGERIASCSSKILSNKNNTTLPLELLSILANVTDVADQLERDSIVLEQGLNYIATEEWSAKATDLKNSIKSDLVTKVNSLFARASNIMSIAEAYKAREQNASLKRLSWITFIFLPLLFVASLYGMNVDILKDNPRWTTYFYIAVPTFALVILTVVVLKYLPLESLKTTYQSFLSFIRIRTRVWDEEKLANSTRDEEQRLLKASVCGSREIIERILHKNPKKLLTIDSDFRASGFYLLCASAGNGHEAVVRLLLEEGIDKNKTDNMGRTPLICALANGHEGVARLLLLDNKGVHRDKADNMGRTPLIWALVKGHEAVARLLLDDEGVDKDKADNMGRTPLIWALVEGHEAVARRLLDNERVDKEKTDNMGRTPLIWALVKGREAAARLLLNDEGIDKDKADRKGRTPLSWAAGKGYEAVVRLLLDEGVDKDKADRKRRTPLSWAAGKGYEAVVRLLLDEGVDKDKADDRLATPLSWAAGNGHEKIVRMLLDEGVDKNKADRWMGTPLGWAAANGHAAIVRILLDEGVDKDKPALASFERTPLSWAAESGHEVVVRLLLDEGVDKDKADNRLRTPLSWAAGSGHDAVVRILLDEGVDKDKADDNLATPLSWAARNGHEVVVRTLLNAGVDKDKADDSLATPLSWAARKGHEAVVRVLLEGGVDKDKADICGKTPLTWAAEMGVACGGLRAKGHGAVVELLLAKT